MKICFRYTYYSHVPLPFVNESFYCFRLTKWLIFANVLVVQQNNDSGKCFKNFISETVVYKESA